MKILLCTADPLERQYCEEQFEVLGKDNSLDVSVVVKDSQEQVFFDEENLALIDLIYIDVLNIKPDGMSLAANLRERGIDTDIVFYTEDESRVFEAFDVEALHYLVAGRIDQQKFEDVFLKAVSRVKRKNAESIMFSCAGERRKILLSDINYFEVQNRIITVYYEGGSFEFYSTMSKIEETLFGKGFVRIHRAYLVARRYINTIKSTAFVCR